MSVWPKQSEVDSFYGNPRGRNGGASTKWESENLTTVLVPFKITYDSRPVTRIRIHKKCADSLLRVLNAIHVAYDKDQRQLDATGITIYGGAYNFRLMRGINRLSMHSWGCAIDFDPARNGLGDSTPNFANHPKILKAFKDEGWTWGGDWSRPDGMHWQAADV